MKIEKRDKWMVLLSENKEESEFIYYMWRICLKSSVNYKYNEKKNTLAFNSESLERKADNITHRKIKRLLE